MLDCFDSAPETVNLLDPDPPTKRVAIECLRRTNPDLTVVWLPMSLLTPMSWLASLAQKVASPRKPAMNVAKAFQSPRYDTSRIAAIVSVMNPASAPSVQISGNGQSW
jgi:hypothetical protein